MSDIRMMAEQEGYFGIVLWQEDDLIEALANHGIEPTEENVQKLWSAMDDDDLCGNMIAAGWDYIYDLVNDIENGLGVTA